MGVGPVVTVLQVVSVQLLPAAAACGVHEATAVGPVDTLLHVTVADGTQAGAPATGLV